MNFFNEVYAKPSLPQLIENPKYNSQVKRNGKNTSCPNESKFPAKFMQNISFNLPLFDDDNWLQGGDDPLGHCSVSLQILISKNSACLYNDNTIYSGNIPAFEEEGVYVNFKRIGNSKTYELFLFFFAGINIEHNDLAQTSGKRAFDMKVHGGLGVSGSRVKGKTKSINASAGISSSLSLKKETDFEYKYFSRYSKYEKASAYIKMYFDLEVNNNETKFVEDINQRIIDGDISEKKAAQITDVGDKIDPNDGNDNFEAFFHVTDESNPIIDVKELKILSN